MDIIICGAGQVGRSIAEQLAREDNIVTIIDKNPTLIQEVSDSLDVKAITGMASHPGVLDKAGASTTDMIIAVTYSDEVNMIACQIARSLFQVPVKVARIRNQSYLDPVWKDLYRQDHLPIDIIISPEMEVASVVMRRLHLPGALDSVPFAGGEVHLLAIRSEKHSPLCNLPLKLVRERLEQHHITLLGVVHHNQFSTGQAHKILSEQDILYLIAKRQDIDKALSLLGHYEQEARRLIILGGGNIGMSMARRLEIEDQHVKVKLIELERDRAEHLASQLQTTTVVNGNGLDKEILSECDIEITDTLVAVTNDDRINILASLLAKRLGCQRTITLVNNATYLPMLESLDIDVLVNPRETTVSSILRHVRRGKINEVHSILDGAAEILEVEVQKQSRLLGKVIGHLSLPKQVQIGAILRDHKLIVPTKSEIIHEGDILIIVSMAESIKQLEYLVASAGEHF